jgi:hypothetical protein
MSSPRLLKIGGFSGLSFSLIWVICATGYLVQVGIPAEPPSLIETVDLMRRPAYQALFWLWPLAYLAVIPFALAAQDHLRPLSPAAARIGSAFLLLYAGLWLVYHALIMAGISVAQVDPVNEGQLGLIFTTTATLASPLFWALILFEASWASTLLRRQGLERVAGWAFALGSASSLIYFIMRYTGPFRPAEVVHEFLILFMILGVGALAISMVRTAED